MPRFDARNPIAVEAVLVSVAAALITAGRLLTRPLRRK